MTLDELIATLPQKLDSEFVMSNADEPIRLAVGSVELSRDGNVFGHVDGELTVSWTPSLQVICVGDTDVPFSELANDQPIEMHFPQIGLSTSAFVIHVQMGQRHEIRALLVGEQNPRLPPSQEFRFYLVNFPSFLGTAVRTGVGPRYGLRRDRLEISAGDFICTIDKIDGTERSGARTNRPGYALTHVATMRRLGQPISPAAIHQLVDLLYWFCAFMRGARTGPVLPSTHSPFAKHWISICPWKVDEPRTVESWLPTHSPLNLDALLDGFIGRWNDPLWNDALRTTLAWYVASNNPSTPNEARITLTQIALEVLASLYGFEDEAAHQRIRALFGALGIPAIVPTRLQALSAFAAEHHVDAAECLTRIRNKFEHPTEKNRQKAATIDGTVRMQAAQYSLELLELSLLALMGYQGKYARRAFQGWKGEDEILVPWG